MRQIVTIIMPIHATQYYVTQSVESILNQSFRDFELIIIDDASDVSTRALLRSFQDKRIHLIQNSKKLGVASSLNIGLKKALGKYIARMDADDIAELDRLARQIAFMETYKSIGVLGTWAKLINHNNKKIGTLKLPIDNLDIKKNIMNANCILHPSVIFRKSLVETYGSYDESLNGAEDYDLWLRYARYTEFHNLPEYLLSYRRSVDSVSFRELRNVELKAFRARWKAWKSNRYQFTYLGSIIRSLGSLMIPTVLKYPYYRSFYRYS